MTRFSTSAPCLHSSQPIRLLINQEAKRRSSLSLPLRRALHQRDAPVYACGLGGITTLLGQLGLHAQPREQRASPALA